MGMRIVVVDDDNLVAISLKTILEASNEIEVVALGTSGKEATRLYEKFKPDVLLMDIRMENMNGLEAAEEILVKDTKANILFLTTFSDDEYIVKALQLGVKGYILKQDFEGIIPALHAVNGGQVVFGTQVVSKIPSLIQKEETFDFRDFDINEKEESIIALVAQGLSNKEISQKLFLSEGTIRNYISSVLEKLALRDRTQLAVFYLQRK